jgi:Ni/Fe-hydrogenase subunit HybB-like protein
MQREAAIREPLILGNKSYKDITDDVVGPIQGPAPIGWKIMITISSIIAVYGVGCILYLIGTGIGVWGLNKTVGWAWDITNFVWWVGIGHAGTLISAVLLLFRQKWRMAINRSAEAMTIFAVIMAAIFPGIHLGELLGVAIAEPIWFSLGQLQFSAALGRFCHLHVLLCIVGVLVHRSHSRLRDHSGPYDQAIRQEGLWFVELWLERKSQALDTV